MVSFYEEASEIVLHDEAYAPTGLSARYNLHAFAPVLLGISAPILLVGLIEPMVLRNGHFIVSMLLTCTMIACVAIYTYSVLVPGPIATARFNRNDRVVSFERRSAFANSSVEVPFGDIASIRMIPDYDRDGYGTMTPMVVMRSREAYVLPAGTGEPHLLAIRNVLGLG